VVTMYFPCNIYLIIEVDFLVSIIIIKLSMKPSWLKVKLPRDDNYQYVKDTLSQEKLNTVCIEAKCPNRIECWGRKAMTFMILGNVCTRNCMFCAVETGDPKGFVDKSESGKIARIVKELSLSYVVITSVTRDDLTDGGASVFAEAIKIIRKYNQNIRIEILVPDFSCDESSIKTVIDAGCDVFSHNLETVERLTPLVRDKKASYQVSLQVLDTARKIKSELITKSGFMLGLGETEEEVKQTIRDLQKIGVQVLTIGQYLQPKKHLHQVVDYVKPEKFTYYKEYALTNGFKKVSAGPLVRSSYFFVN